MGRHRELGQRPGIANRYRLLRAKRDDPSPRAVAMRSSTRTGHPPTRQRFRTAVPTWNAGDTIPLSNDRALRVVDTRPGEEPEGDPVLVVEAA